MVSLPLTRDVQERRYCKLLKTLFRYVPWLLFAISSTVAGLAGLFLPETVGRKLPETLEDAEDQERDDVWLNKVNAFLFGNQDRTADRGKV